MIDQEGRELHLYLEELNEFPEGYSRSCLESKGFHKEAIINPTCFFFPQTKSQNAKNPAGVKFHMPDKQCIIKSLSVKSCL